MKTKIYLTNNQTVLTTVPYEEFMLKFNHEHQVIEVEQTLVEFNYLDNTEPTITTTRTTAIMKHSIIKIEKLD